jgi:hypothetical protein
MRRGPRRKGYDSTLAGMKYWLRQTAIAMLMLAAFLGLFIWDAPRQVRELQAQGFHVGLPEWLK